MSIDPTNFILLDAAVPEQRARWEDLWDAWPHGDVVAHPGYVQLFARPEDRGVCACQVGRSGGILFPLIVRPLCVEPWAGGETESCDLVSPYGYGGPFGWGSFDVDAFWEGFDQWARAMHAVSLFARLSLFKDQLIPFYGETIVKGLCVIVSLKQDPDDIFRGYEKAARENIRQAKRAGVTVEPDPDCRRLEEFLAVYSATMNRLGALPIYYFPRSFFDRLIAELAGHVVLFHALHHQRVLSTELLLISEHYLYSFLGGTLEEGFPLRANPLLRHEINLWARANGKQQVVLGGGYSGQDSLLRYKQRYAPNGGVAFSVGTRIFDSTSYEALIDIRAAWERRQGNQWSPPCDYFPAYRG